MIRFDRLTRTVGERIDDGRGVPLLALRIPALEAIAWREGRRGARLAQRRALAKLQTAGVLRAGDAIAHRSGSDRFAVALLAPARSGRLPDTPAVRMALLRIADAAARTTGHRIQSGWCTLTQHAELDSLGATIEAALERGLRERERGELLATLGHELRTPLNAIGGYLETLLEGGVEARTARRFLRTARHETLRLGRMAEGLLAVSLLDFSAPRGQDCCDPGEAIVRCVEGLSPFARRRGIQIRERVAGGCTARIDGDLCVQAVWNLLHNALKWAASRVDIACARYGGAITMHVDDDGPGIAPEDRERVFAFGVRGASCEQDGAGIGLAIVRAIARRFGGEAFAAASPLGGARLVLRLPVLP